MRVRRHTLVLSVYLNSHGFGFVLFEGHLSPFDWGTKQIRGSNKQRRCLERIAKLIDRNPDVLVLQNTSPNGTRRAGRIMRLNAMVADLAVERGIPVYAYSRADVCDVFRHLGFSNKQMLAELIAKQIPAFVRYVPPPRKPWMSEDARMGLFDAAALVLVFF